MAGASVCIAHWLHPATLWGRYYYTHFTDKETRLTCQPLSFTCVRAEIWIQFCLTLIPMLYCATEGHQYAEIVGKEALLTRSGDRRPQIAVSRGWTSRVVAPPHSLCNFEPHCFICKPRRLDRWSQRSFLARAWCDAPQISRSVNAGSVTVAPEISNQFCLLNPWVSAQIQNLPEENSLIIWQGLAQLAITLIIFNCIL